MLLFARDGCQGTETAWRRVKLGAFNAPRAAPSRSSRASRYWPHARLQPIRAAPGALLGFFVFFVLERYAWRHRHGTSHADEGGLPPLAALNVLGDAAHNVIDGMAIGAAFLTSSSLGLTTSIAVVLHEVPQEIGDFGVLLHAGLPRRRAVTWNLLSALAAFTGAILVLLMGSHVASLSAALLPVAAGGFIYIAASDLVPELKRETGQAESLAIMVAMLLGIGVMVALEFLTVG